MGRIARLLVIVPLVAACATAPGVTGVPISSGVATGPSPTAGAPTTGPHTGAPPSAAPSMVAASPAATPLPSSTEAAGGCPTNSPLTVAEFGDAFFLCFGPEDVEIRGWIDAPSDVGFEGPAIEPGWLAYPAEPIRMLWNSPPGDDQTCGGAPGCGGIFVHISPGSDITFDGPPRWVIATGHTMDPVAATCHYVAENATFNPEENSFAQLTCQGHFVLTGLRDAP